MINECRMLRAFLVYVLMSQMAFGLFRFIAGIGRDEVIANTIGSFALIVLLVLGGYALSRGLQFIKYINHP